MIGSLSMIFLALTTKTLSAKASAPEILDRRAYQLHYRSSTL